MKELQGLSLKNISVSIYQKERLLTPAFGEMLFTHFGVSGPVLLFSQQYGDSPAIRRGELHMELDFKPALTEAQLDARILREFEVAKNKQLKNVMGSLLPSGAIPPVLRAASVAAEKPIMMHEGGERTPGAGAEAFPDAINGTAGL